MLAPLNVDRGTEEGAENDAAVTFPTLPYGLDLHLAGDSDHPSGGPSRWVGRRHGIALLLRGGGTSTVFEGTRAAVMAYDRRKGKCARIVVGGGESGAVRLDVGCISKWIPMLAI